VVGVPRGLQAGPHQHADFGAFDLVDCGDVPVFPTDAETTHESVAAHVATVADQGAMPVVVGGDHSCSVPAVEGFADGIGADRVGLVQVDAHTDTVRESALFGDHYHGSSTHHIADSAVCDYEHVAQVGIRGYESSDFFAFADETGLQLATQADVREAGIGPVVERAVDHAAEGTDAVYVTFDIDAVDPSVAPGTGTPEPGGLSTDEAVTVMETVGRRSAVGAVDLMEVAPAYDPTEGTQRLAAFLLVTFLEHRLAAA
jgi:agmatinase